MEAAKKLWEDLNKKSQKELSELSKKAAIVCFIFFLLLFIAHLATLKHRAEKPKIPLVVSIDGDAEDYVALYYLFHRGDIDVQLVILNGRGWSSSLTSAYENLVMYFQLLANDGIKVKAEIRYGASFSSTPNASTACTPAQSVVPQPYALITDYLYGSSFTLRREFQQPPAGMSKVPGYYAPYLVKLLNAAPVPMVLLSLSSLTDFSVFFAANPSLVSKVKHLMVDGGVFGLTSQGNVRTFLADNTNAEFNLFFDYDSSEAILERTKLSKVYMSTLDAQASVPASKKAMSTFFEADTSASHLTTRQWLYLMLDNYQKYRPVSSSWTFYTSLVTAIASVERSVLWTAGVASGALDVTTRGHGIANAGEVRKSSDVDSKGKPMIDVILTYNVDALTRHFNVMMASPWPKD